MGVGPSKSDLPTVDPYNLPKVEKKNSDFEEYEEFREQLVKFSLGEAAFDYAERVFRRNPDDRRSMAFLADTAVMYDESKVKDELAHRADRLDLLQRGIDVSRKCMKENPEYFPCYRAYVLCAGRAADSVYRSPVNRGLGDIQNILAIKRRADKAIELDPSNGDVPNMMASLCSRCLLSWWNPVKAYRWHLGVPNNEELTKLAIGYHLKAVIANPEKIEFATRLGHTYYLANDFPNARRWFVKVRDEMEVEKIKDQKWLGMAHTILATKLQKNGNWNVPIG